MRKPNGRSRRSDFDQKSTVDDYGSARSDYSDQEEKYSSGGLVSQVSVELQNR